MSIKVFLSAVIYLCMLTLNIKSVQASFLPVDYLFTEAEDNLKQGNYSQATGFISKILYTKPDYQPALNLFKSMENRNLLSEEDKANWAVFIELKQFNEETSIKIDHYLQQRNEVLSKLKNKGYTDQFLNNRLLNFQIKLVDSKRILEGRLSEINNTYAMDLKKLVQAYSVKRDYLIEQLGNVEGQLKEVSLIDNDRRPTLSKTDIVIAAHPLENQSKVLPADLNNEDQFSGYKKQIRELQESLEEKNLRINELMKQLKGISNHSSFQTSSADMPENSDQNIRDDYADLKSRFELSQKIIEKKDKEIQEIQTRLKNAQAGEQTDSLHEANPPIHDSPASIEYQLEEVSGILQIYKMKLSDIHQTLKTNVIHTQELEEKLALVQNKLFERDQLIQKTEESMQKLEQKLLELQNELDNLRQSSLNGRNFNLKEKFTLQQQLNNIKQFIAVEWNHLHSEDQP